MCEFLKARGSFADPVLLFAVLLSALRYRVAHPVKLVLSTITKILIGTKQFTFLLGPP
jgi:hypothetical protein